MWDNTFLPQINYGSEKSNQKTEKEIDYLLILLILFDRFLNF